MDLAFIDGPGPGLQYSHILEPPMPFYLLLAVITALVPRLALPRLTSPDQAPPRHVPNL